MPGTGAATPPAHQTASSTAPGTGCSLVPTGSRTEFGSCLRVEASLDRAPELDQTADLRVHVLAQRDLGEVKVRVDVPAGLEIVDGPGADRATVGALAGPGRVTPRVATISPGAGSKILTFRVRATDLGAAMVEVRATVPLGAGATDGAMATVPLTVAARPGTSTLSIPTGTRGGTVAAPDSPAAVVPDPGYRQAPPSREPAAVGGKATDDRAIRGRGAVALGLQSCISGRWGYDNPSTGYTGVPNYGVQIWDEDNLSGDDLLASGVTGSDGSYHLCYTDTDGFGEGEDAQETYVLYVSENSVWRVRDNAANDETYENQSTTVGVDEGDDFDWGDRSPGNNIDRGIHAFHAINKLWQWGVDPNGLCFDWGAVNCRQLTVNWTSSSVDGTFYSLSGNDVHLLAADPDSEHTVIHEATHAVMDDVYNDSYPSIPNCNPHTVQGISSTGCAWTEGFAEWVPAAVLNDPFYRWPSGASLDLENVDSLSGGWSDGDSVEGRVAGAMIDIQDSAVATKDFFDFWSEGDMEQYEAFQDYASVGNGVRPATYSQFWSDRSGLGLNTANTGANGSNNQNTVNYTFSAPTCDGSTVTDFGTSSANTITGTSGVDVIHGLAGNDTISGLGSADIVCGGDGDDTLEGGGGSDELRGLGGADDVEGGTGADSVGGGAGSPDDCDGGGGSDTNLGGCETLTSVP
jgi:hypothetical protein